MIAVQINIVCDSLTFFPSFYFAKAFKKGPELKNSADQEAYLIVHLDAIYVRQSTLMNRNLSLERLPPTWISI